VSKNISTQLPTPPELQPLPATRRRLGQAASYLLIAAGLALLSWGGWLFFQTQLEAIQPPPARIVEVSLADLETPSPRPSPTAPAATPTRRTATGDTLIVPPSATAATATAELTPTPPPTATVEPVLSMADNPLVVNAVEAATAEPAAPTAAPPVAAPAPLTRLLVESIKLDTPVVEVGWTETVQNGQPVNVWNVADHAAGWHKNSLLPGQGGNIVLSGHHNIKGEVFRYIVDLQPGAILSLYMGEERFDYTVVDKFIVKDKGEPEEVRRANARWIGPFNEERVTLVTCWPYTNNTHRVIVIAKPM